MFYIVPKINGLVCMWKNVLSHLFVLGHFDEKEKESVIS